MGAPQFFLKDGEVGGAVFVYINREGKWDEVTPVPLYGRKDSMFGLSVENIGDINQDSYEGRSLWTLLTALKLSSLIGDERACNSFTDIAVGAPYDDGGAGKVYIYHGSADGINTTPAQVSTSISDWAWVWTRARSLLLTYETMRCSSVHQEKDRSHGRAIKLMQSASRELWHFYKGCQTMKCMDLLSKIIFVCRSLMEEILVWNYLDTLWLGIWTWTGTPILILPLALFQMQYLFTGNQHLVVYRVIKSLLIVLDKIASLVVDKIYLFWITLQG